MQTQDSPDADAIINECDAIKALLLEKNRAIGSSAFEPIHVFSKLDALAAIDVRIDDKLARLKQAKDFKEDTELDLMGYLVLRRIARKKLVVREVSGSVAKHLSNQTTCTRCNQLLNRADAVNREGHLYHSDCASIFSP